MPPQPHATAAPAPSDPHADGRCWWGREFALVVVVATALNFCGLTWGLPNSHDWAIDSITPLGPLFYVHQLVTTGHWWAKYPPLQFTILAGLYAPYVAYLVATGRLDLEAAVAHYPYGLADPERSLTMLVLIGRVLTASMGVGTAVLCYATAGVLAGRRAGLFAGLLFAASPLAVYYAHTGNLDIPYMFWASLALYSLVRVARGAPARTYVLLGVFVAAAVATKDQAYGMFVVMPVALLVQHWRQAGARALRDERLLLGLGAAVLAYVLAANVVVDLPGWLRHVRHITREGSMPYQLWPVTPAGYLGLAGRTLYFVTAALTLPALVLAAAGLVIAGTRRMVGAGYLVLAMASYLTLFLGVVMYVLPRFVLPVVLGCAVLAGIAAARLWETRSRAARIAVLGIVAYALARGAAMDAALLQDTRYEAEAWMASHLASDATIGTEGEPTYLPRFPRGVTLVPVTMTPRGLVVEGAPPDYLVLSDAHYRRYLRRPAFRPAMERLLAGEGEYRPLAVFEHRRLRATRLIPSVSPRIVIMQRRRADARRSGGNRRLV